MISKIKEMLSELSKFKVQKILDLDYKKRNDIKIFHSSAKLTDSDSDIDETFKSTHQSIKTNQKKYTCEDWNVLDVTIKHDIKVFACKYKEKK